MEFCKIIILLVCGLIVTVLPNVLAVEGQYARAVVESCRGCSLNRLPQVKAFINDDLPDYENTEFKHIQGARPELVLYNQNEEEVERLELQDKSRQECNELLVSKGFKKSATPVRDEI